MCEYHNHETEKAEEDCNLGIIILLKVRHLVHEAWKFGNGLLGSLFGSDFQDEQIFDKFSISIKKEGSVS